MRHKHADLIHAWAEEGAEIEVYDSYCKVWKPCISPCWVPICRYRVKPTTKLIRYRNYLTPDGRMGVVVEGVKPPKDCSWVGDWQEVEVKA